MAIVILVIMIIVVIIILRLVTTPVPGEHHCDHDCDGDCYGAHITMMMENNMVTQLMLPPLWILLHCQLYFQLLTAAKQLSPRHPPPPP